MKIQFGRDQVEDLSLLGATFGVDVYFMPNANIASAESSDPLYQDVEAYLSVATSTLTREELSSQIGTEGDPLVSQRVLPAEKDAGLAAPPVWLLRSLLPPSVELEMHVDNVLQRSRMFSEKILKVSRAHDVCVWCVVTTNDRIVVELVPAHVRGLSRLGAAFGINYRVSQ